MPSYSLYKIYIWLLEVCLILFAFSLHQLYLHTYLMKYVHACTYTYSYIPNDKVCTQLQATLLSLMIGTPIALSLTGIFFN